MEQMMVFCSRCIKVAATISHFWVLTSGYSVTFRVLPTWKDSGWIWRINYACSNILWSCLTLLLIVIHCIEIKELDISDFCGIFGRIAFAQMPNNLQI